MQQIDVMQKTFVKVLQGKLHFLRGINRTQCQFALVYSEIRGEKMLPISEEEKHEVSLSSILSSKIDCRGSQKTQFQGYEEIWRDGHREVHHWADSDKFAWLSEETYELLDFWLIPASEFELPIAEYEMGTKFHSFRSFPRYIKPIKVEPQEAGTRKWVLGEQLSKVKQFFTLGWQKVQKISQRLPLAFKAAWRELNSVN